jgi:hypothetical protein
MLELLILNANGTILEDVFEGEPSEVEAYLNSSSFRNSIEGSKFNWGVYRIEGSKIFIDQWSQDSNGRFWGNRITARILSDSSFKEISLEECDGSNFTSMNFTFVYHPLTNKPDSVTWLIP